MEDAAEATEDVAEATEDVAVSKEQKELRSISEIYHFL